MYKFNLVNLAQAGAGNTYIQESTVEELSKRNYDYVIIMWSGLSRIDYKIENINLLIDSKYTSRYQKLRNDWEGKLITPVNDQDYVDDNWVFGCGVLNKELALTKTNIFNSIYKHLGYKQFVYHSLQKMISLQSFLKAQNIPYLFTFYQDYLTELQIQPSLYNLLDQTNIYNKKNIFSIAKDFNDIDETLHPNTKTHFEWSKLLKEFIDATN
jgi:hypothetical protein